MQSVTIPSSSFWQSLPWKSILIDSHQAEDVVLYCYDGASILIEFRSIGLGFLGAFSLGVDISHYSPEFFRQCREYVRKRGALFYQIEEYISQGRCTDDIQSVTYGKHFLEPWTSTIDLTLSPEDILSAMHEKGRYNIKLAEKRSITTQWVTPTQENIDIWMTLLRETTSRDRFHENSELYYKVFLENLEKYNAGGLLFAYYENIVIAAGIFVHWDDVTLYYYGASSSDKVFRKHMAPYLIQWTAIQSGKSRGSKVYDFLGIAPPGIIEHPLAGVTNFKEKFRGKNIMIGSKSLLIARPVFYRLFTLFRTTKNMTQYLKDRIKKGLQKSESKEA